ncbi:MAG: IS1 family transposase [Ignavibacteriae bacterium]|nr:IS1 family transposase [Ignavibacteriota bacterium]
MNALPASKKTLILSHLVEGLSVRSIERLTGVHRDTIIRLMLSAGNVARDILDREMMNLDIKRIQVDEIWTYIGKKQKRLRLGDPLEYGDAYTFVALDPDTKLIPAFSVGKRNSELSISFLSELKARIRSRFQLSTDAFSAYRDAVDYVFGEDIDYAQIHKRFSVPEKVIQGEHRYSPPDCVGITIKPITGFPVRKHISTSLVERQNLTIRMNMRRFTRLTNAFSKRLTSLKAALAIHFFHYNFVRVHRTLRVTPAMEAGLTNTIWSLEKLLYAHQYKQAA